MSTSSLRIRTRIILAKCVLGLLAISLMYATIIITESALLRRKRRQGIPAKKRECPFFVFATREQRGLPARGLGIVPAIPSHQGARKDNRRTAGFPSGCSALTARAPGRSCSIPRRAGSGPLKLLTRFGKGQSYVRVHQSRYQRRLH